MKTTKCPGCKEILLPLKAKFSDQSIRNVFAHPETLKECPYKSDDGLRISIEITDELMCQKFQELISSEGISEEVIEETNVAPLKTNEERIKKRLASGSLSIEEFKIIKELLNTQR